MAIELQCGRCSRSVSFDRVEPGTLLFCPICKEPIQVKQPKTTEIAPRESDSVPWWVSNASVPASELTPINPKSDAFLVFAPPPPSASDCPTMVDGPALGDTTLPNEVVPSPVADRPISRPRTEVTPSRRSASAASPRRARSAAALLPGVVAFTILWFPTLLPLGLILSASGLLFSGLMLGQAVVRGRRGVDFLLAAFLVNLQSLILAVFFLAS